MNTTLNSVEQRIVIFYVCALVPTIALFGAGILMLGVLFAGALLVKRTKNFEYLNIAFIVFRSFLFLITLALSASILRYGRLDDILSISVLIAPYLYIFVFEYYFVPILRKHKDWVVEHGILSSI